jgi:hypothetical protein
MIKVYSTFSKKNYEDYGERFINSLIKYWPKETEFIFFLDFYIENLPNNFKILLFNETFTTHDKFKDLVKSKFTNTAKDKSIAEKTIKFSYKGFVIDLLAQQKNGIGIWLDADVETIDYISKKDLQSILDEKFLACQTEKQTRKYPHIESGILIFDLTHNDLKLFQEYLADYYHKRKFVIMKKPYDGYIIGRILTENKFNFVDFNKDILTIGKKSHKDETFLHPFLKKRFIHWIGDTKV